MKAVPLILSFVFATFLFGGEETGPRVWRAVTGHESKATFLGLEAGQVRLKLEDGREVSLALHQLAVEDRTEAQRLQRVLEARVGEMPRGEVTAPTGRREITWRELDREHWPDFLPPAYKRAALNTPRPWRHAESRYFVIHFQQLGFARQVARIADFYYEYIASNLPGFEDRYREKSHIIIFRNRDEWQQFLTDSRAVSSWAAAFVGGRIMYLQDLGDTEANADIIAHEMSHLVLNRFFRHRPPLWLDEGLAEWYRVVGYRAFKGQRADPRRTLGRVRNPYDLETLFSMRGYPQDREDVSRYYETSRHLVGMLMLEKGMEEFVRFLQLITVEGRPPMEAITTVYGYEDVAALQAAFTRFIR